MRDLVDLYTYLQALKAGVAAGITAGQSVDETKTMLFLDDYPEWGMYDTWRVKNIERIYAYLKRIPGASGE